MSPGLELSRPLAVVDLETTGTTERDRAVQIGVVKVYPDGTITEWTTLVNPEMSIPAEATRIHGVSNDDVANAPTFRQIAVPLAKGLKNCDIAGYNVRFDIRVLLREYRRIGFPLDAGILDGHVVDAYRIFQSREKRNLSAAVRFYLGESFDDAHDAMTDARATLSVLMAQLERYPDLPRTPEQLHVLLFETPGDGFADADGKFAYRDGKICLNFGKHAALPITEIDNGFLRWMMKGDFSADTKRIVEVEIRRRKDEKADSNR